MELLFAQTGQASPEVTSWLGLLGSLGFAVWYGYYVTAITIPKINTDNNALTSKLVSEFRDEMKVARADHASAMDAQRDECKREMEWMMAAFQANVKRPVS
jgi:hypothetical protein